MGGVPLPAGNSSARQAASRVLPIAVSMVWLAASTVAGVRAIMDRTGGRFIYALDDAYIHMSMAASLARHGIWGCTPDRFSAASSSPLWTAWLGVVYALSGVHDWTPLVLNLLTAIATLWVADAWLRQEGAGLLTRAATLGGLVLVVPLPAMMLFGMEHVLHVLITVAFAWQAVRVLSAPQGAAGGDGTGRLALLAALLAASRYEGLFLVLLVCIASALRGRWGRAIVIGLSALAPLIVLGLVSVASGSFFLPNSVLIKAGGQQASVLGILFKPFAPDLEALADSLPLATLVAVGIALTAVGRFRARTLWAPSVLAPLLVVGMVLLHLHFELSSGFWVYRYDAYLLGAGLVGVAVALVAVLPDLAAAVVVAAMALAIGGPLSAAYPANEVESAEATFREHVRLAEFVRQTMPGDTVLVNDVGAMGYFSAAHMFDIYGLCDVTPVRLRRAGHYDAADVDAWTRPLGATAAIVQLSWGWVGQHLPATWVKVAELDLLREGRLVGVFAMGDDDREVRFLRAAVDAYFRPLEPQGYRVRLFY